MWSWAPCYQCSYLELYFNQNYLQWDGVSAGQAAGPREDDFTSDESESPALTNKSKASIAARGLSRTGARWRPGIPGMRWWWASSTLSSSAGNKVNNLICLFVFHDLQNNTTLFAGNSFSIQEALGLPDNIKICTYNGLGGPTSSWTINGSTTKICAVWAISSDSLLCSSVRIAKIVQYYFVVNLWRIIKIKVETMIY